MMAISPSKITVTDVERGNELCRAGQRLIEIGMAIRDGFDVDVTYEAPVAEPTTRKHEWGKGYIIGEPSPAHQSSGQPGTLNQSIAAGLASSSGVVEKTTEEALELLRIIYAEHWLEIPPTHTRRRDRCNELLGRMDALFSQSRDDYKGGAE